MFDEEPLPPAVVLDSDFVINVLHENEDYHDECMAFAGRLFDASVPIVYSNLLRVDFWHGWRRAVNAKGVPLEIASAPMLMDDAAAQRERWFQRGDEYLKTFLALFDRYEVRVGTRLLDRALRLMARYNLRSHDACVAAMAFHAEVLDVVSLDADFLRVDDLHVWNNGVPARRAAKRRHARPDTLE
ncbi:MAG TPA: PIN domain-containing protein [Dehalococcoidia bacterium]|nr:PIN domain-containing protein [Dehalococcoidia bacterium]